MPIGNLIIKANKICVFVGFLVFLFFKFIIVNSNGFKKFLLLMGFVAYRHFDGLNVLHCVQNIYRGCESSILNYKF